MLALNGHQGYENMKKVTVEHAARQIGCIEPEIAKTLSLRAFLKCLCITNK